MEGRF